ncbi:MAG: mechanosensitive ion channel family protein, partial [Thermoplasmata archaeon]
VVVLTIILLMLGISNVHYLIISIIMFTIIISALIFLTTPLKNWISGVILMYTGAFLENDNVQIGDKINGKVIEIDTLFTKILDEETMIELIPNSLILSNKIAIKSSVFSNIPIILQFNVSFKVPHEKIEELIMDAIKGTENVLDIQPRPAINAVKFENDKIVYELKVYIENFDKKEEIISKLIFKIQDKFLAEKIIIGI